MTEQLKPLPCPFCGGINIIHCAHHMYCHACGADGPDADSAYESEALEAWNRRAQPAQAVHLHQALTDPENQPNQYGVEFFMHGPKFAFKVGTQQFTLDYEPTEPGEFEFMQAALIYAFSVFTPDVKTAQAVPLLSLDEVADLAMQSGAYDEQLLAFARAVEQAVRAKMGVAVPMTDAQINDAYGEARVQHDHIPHDDVARIARSVEKHHGIVGKEGA